MHREYPPLRSDHDRVAAIAPLTRTDVLGYIRQVRVALDDLETATKRGAFDPCDCGHSKVQHGDIHEGPAAGYRPCLVAGCDCIHFDDHRQQITELGRKTRLAEADAGAWAERTAA